MVDCSYNGFSKQYAFTLFCDLTSVQTQLPHSLNRLLEHQYPQILSTLAKADLNAASLRTPRLSIFTELF